MSQQPEKPNPNLTKILDKMEQDKKDVMNGFENLKAALKDAAERLPPLEKVHTPVEPEKLKGETDKHADVDVDSSEPTSDIFVRHLLKCPECYEKVAKEAYGVSLDSECVGCGKPVNEKSEKCPFCGGTHARKRAK